MCRLVRSGLLLLVVGCLLTPGVAVGASSSESDRHLAVLEFTGRALESDALGAFSDAVRGGAVDGLSGRGAKVMTRENMLFLLREMGKSECTEGDCEIETARNIGADFVISGAVVYIENTYVVVLKLHETKKGSLLGSETVQGKTQLTVLGQLRHLGREMAARVPGGSSMTAAAAADAAVVPAAPRAVSDPSAVSGTAAPPPILNSSARSNSTNWSAASARDTAASPASASAPLSSPISPTGSADPGVHNHDGFYLRVSGGIGKLSVNNNNYSGYPYEIQLGWTVADRIVLFTDIFNLLRDDENSWITHVTGVGLNYWTSSNYFIAGALGLAYANKSDGSKYTDVGSGLNATFGKEWWVSDEWAVGGAVQFCATSFRDTDDSSVSTTNIGLMLVGTYN